MTPRIDRPGRRPAEPDDNFLARRYLAALALVALLVLLDQALIQPPLYGLASDVPVIHIAVRQQVLSQRLAKSALELERSADETGRRVLLGEMEMLLMRLIAAHEGLRDGNEALMLPGRNSKEVEAALAGIEPSFRKIRDAAGRLVEQDPSVRPDSAEVRADLATILATEREYLVKMGQIVALFEVEARARVDRLRRTGWAVTVLILVALIGIGLFILRPAARLIRRQFAEAREARDALEVRVSDRTIELERANRELQHQAEERSRSQARHRSMVEQLSHVARIRTIGEMATGLAHELNQPLGAVANYVEGCLVALEAPEVPVERVKEALGKALASTLRAGEIIRRIRQFVTRRPVEPGRFAPNRVVEEVGALLSDEAVRRGIALKLRLAPELPRLSGDLVQVQQVLVNLVRNATEAVVTTGRPAPEIVMETRVAESGDVEFRVTDNGEGIRPDRLGLVFDPFFSTRAQGLGMGLAISRTIIEAHHGRLSVESVPGALTTFRFTLPATDDLEEPDDDPDRLHRG